MNTTVPSVSTHTNHQQLDKDSLTRACKVTANQIYGSKESTLFHVVTCGWVAIPMFGINYVKEKLCGPKQQLFKALKVSNADQRNQQITSLLQKAVWLKTDAEISQKLIIELIGKNDVPSMKRLEEHGFDFSFKVNELNLAAYTVSKGTPLPTFQYLDKHSQFKSDKVQLMLIAAKNYCSEHIIDYLVNEYGKKISTSSRIDRVLNALELKFQKLEKENERLVKSYEESEKQLAWWESDEFYRATPPITPKVNFPSYTLTGNKRKDLLALRTAILDMREENTLWEGRIQKVEEKSSKYRVSDDLRYSD